MGYESHDPKFQSLDDEGVARFEKHASENSPTNQDWSGFHPIIRRKWEEMGLIEGIWFIVYQADGTEQKICGLKPGLEDLQRVCNGYIEVVAVPGSDCVLVVNEEGLLKGFTQNPIASQIAGKMIVGPAVFMERKLIS